jgi:predicted phosphodiesterase
VSRKESLYYYEGAQPTALLEAFREASELMPVIKPTPYVSKRKAETFSRVLTVALSDLHFGTDLKADEHLLAFSNKEEARRLAHILKNVLDYKTDKRDFTSLQILLNGDLFAGMLGHDDRAVAELSVQMLRAAHLLTQFVAQCCAHFRKVVVRVQYGNHGKNKMRHATGRADNQKWENFELIVAVMMQGPLRDHKNLSWDIPRRPISFFKVFDHQFGMTHGDTVLGAKPGTTTAEGALARVMASKFYKLNGKLDVLFLGHWHKGMLESVGDTVVLTNPPLIPPDGFSESSGYLNACGQWLVETTAAHPVGDTRLVRVGEEQDKDRNLDALISPWTESLVFTHVEST